MPLFPNPNRIMELFEEEKVLLAAQTVKQLAARDVLKAAACCWGVFLLMLLTLLLTIRLGVTLPLF